MHFRKIHFLRCINAVGCVKKRHAPRCIHKMQAILSVYPREVRLELYLGFYAFHFRFVQVHFFYLNFIKLFPCLIKYYHIMFIDIAPPPRG